MTITIGSWVIPLAITIGFFLYCMTMRDEGYGVGPAIMFFIIGVPCSLTSWLVWALIT